ncbi:VPS4-associated protein 1 [Aspergillus avenaceus]|uniref:VPS4-associated protein 1 n=1 Tax=Aspergillus avenaceus TaxID=36643 RepID=A0A5N6TVP0_ASPAV|nr:VPS4-associated protein 1 [Aspergillus avenaceus]
MSLQNVYHLRRVADTAARSCYICHKPSSSVLITPDNKDHFYVCPVHLKDRNFCSAIVDTEDQEKKAKDEALAREIEIVKKEYEEKQKRKKEKEKQKSDESAKDKEGTSEKKEDTNSDDKERDNKIESLQKSAPTASTSDDGPRIFALHKNFYQMRIDRLRNLEAAKRNRQRLQDPSFFPSVPSGGI